MTAQQEPEYIITKEDYDQIYCIEYPLTSEERRRICDRSRPLSDMGAQRCLVIESCHDCTNRMEMKELYKPYGMIPLPNGKESYDFVGRWVCTASDDREIKNYTNGFPKWCPLSCNIMTCPGAHDGCMERGAEEPKPTNILAIPCPKCGAWTFRANIDEGYQILCSDDTCGWKQKIEAQDAAAGKADYCKHLRWNTQIEGDGDYRCELWNKTSCEWCETLGKPSRCGDYCSASPDKAGDVLTIFLNALESCERHPSDLGDIYLASDIEAALRQVQQ